MSKNLTTIAFGILIVLGFLFLFVRLLTNYGENGSGEKDDLIRVSAPKTGDTVESPLAFSGEARGMWFFEASFPVSVTDKTGKELGVGIAQAESEWMTENFVPFSGKVDFNADDTTEGFVVFMKDNPSGLPEHDDSFRIPVSFRENAGERMSVKVYFGNSVKNPETLDCALVYPVLREIPKRPDVGRAALLELLKGPTLEEKNEGFYTSVNPGVTLEKLTITNGVGTAKFDSELERAVGGSCRVTAIRAQIEETLKQFSTVKDVIISVDGRTKDILQP